MSKQQIDLRSPLTFRTAFQYSLQTELSRKEILWGAVLLLVPVVGWLLNMGHRIMMTHRMQHGQSAWPAWQNYGSLFRHGLITFLGMVEYHSPALVCELIAFQLDLPALHVLAAVLWIAGSVAVPGYMAHYCYTLNPAEVFDPFLALRRVFEGGTAYWRAWGIALTALCLSFSGLLFFGIGFLVTSVWFWQVAGFVFATVFTQRFKLQEDV